MVVGGDDARSTGAYSISVGHPDLQIPGLFDPDLDVAFELPVWEPIAVDASMAVAKQAPASLPPVSRTAAQRDIRPVLSDRDQAVIEFEGLLTEAADELAAVLR